MIDAPHGILETPLGVVHFTMTEAAHVWLHTEKDAVITIRGIPYHVSYHCHLINGRWTAESHRDPYLSRTDHKEPSQPRKTAREVLAQAWYDYLRDHPDLPLKAECAKVSHEIEQLENDLAELQKKTAAKVAELAAVKKRQATL